MGCSFKEVGGLPVGIRLLLLGSRRLLGLVTLFQSLCLGRVAAAVSGAEPRLAEAEANPAKGWANQFAKDHNNRLPIRLSIKLSQRGEDY